MITLLVREETDAVIWLGEGSCAETMYCSFRMSCIIDQRDTSDYSKEEEEDIPGLVLLGNDTGHLRRPKAPR